MKKKEAIKLLNILRFTQIPAMPVPPYTASYGALSLPMKRKIAFLLLISGLLFGKPVSTAFSEVTHGAHKIVGIDENAHTFTVRFIDKRSKSHAMGSSREEIFKVTENTTYFVGENRGSWADLKKGLWVRVSFEPGPRLNRYLTPRFNADAVYISNNALE